MKTACILAIGDELLNGFTLDTNSHWIKEKLFKYNIKVQNSMVVPDEETSIINSLKFIINQKYDILFITGGIGPTHDDITKKTLSKFLGKNIHINQAHMRYLKKNIFNKHFKKHINENRKIDQMIESQCATIDSFVHLDNKIGTALGMSGTHN